MLGVYCSVFIVAIMHGSQPIRENLCCLFHKMRPSNLTGPRGFRRLNSKFELEQVLLRLINLRGSVLANRSIVGGFRLQ